MPYGFRHLLCSSIAVLAISLWGCSVRLTKGEPMEKTGTPANEGVPLFQRIPLILGTDTLWLEQDLITAYNSATNQKSFPQPQCQGSAQILATVRQNAQAGAEGIPLVIFPLWPFQPIDETWTYRLTAQISCDGAIVKQVEFTEDETIRATWYGKMRSDLLNAASAEMHRKLSHRLAFELDYPYNADLNSRSDY